MNDGVREPVPIIYIAGSSHSGSTLLDLVLGAHSSIESDGEVQAFHEYTSPLPERPDNRVYCTCGRDFRECPYWLEVRARLVRQCGSDQLDLQARSAAEFEENNYRVLGTILEVSGKPVLCDSSKRLGRLRQLLESSLFDVHVVHLVRDGRAVAFGHERKTEGPGLAGARYGYLPAIRKWRDQNAGVHREFLGRDNYTLVRYEDLVRNPRAEVQRLMERCRLEFEPAQLRFWDVEHHNIAGNRMRMLGPQPIKEDTRYSEQLSLARWWLGTAIAWRTLRLFGYHIGRPSVSRLRAGERSA